MIKPELKQEITKRMDNGSMTVQSGMGLIAGITRGEHDKLLRRLSAQPVGVLVDAMEGKV